MCSSYFLLCFHGHTLYAIHVFCGCVSFPLRKSELHQSLSEPSVHEAFLWNQGAHWNPVLSISLCCVVPQPQHEDGESSHICLSVNATTRIRNAILYPFYRASNGLTTCWALFWFAAAGDGMELTWSLSIWSPRGPVRAPLQSAATTPRHWFTVQGLFFACGLKDNWIMGEARGERERWEMDGVWAPGQRETREMERLKCLILLIASGDFLFLQTAQYADGKQRWAHFSRSRPPKFTDVAKDSGSKVTCRIEEHDCGQVCASRFAPKRMERVCELPFLSLVSKSFSVSRGRSNCLSAAQTHWLLHWCRFLQPTWCKAANLYLDIGLLKFKPNNRMGRNMTMWLNMKSCL